MSNRQEGKYAKDAETVARMDFLRLAVIVAIGGGVGSCAPAPTLGRDGNPASAGYILVDAKKCQGCLWCVLTCSLVHEREANL